MDSIWKSLALQSLEQIQAERKTCVEELAEIQKSVPRAANEAEDEIENEDQDLVTEGKYTQLPVVMVDEDPGAIFPMSWSRPHRISWYEEALGAQHVLRGLKRLQSRLEEWAGDTKALAPTQKMEAYSKTDAEWSGLQAQVLTLTRQMRYLDFWIPPLHQEWKQAKAIGRKPASVEIVESLLRADSTDFSNLRQALRPRRVIQPAFLPKELHPDQSPDQSDDIPLEPVFITLPIATDITDRKFIAEVDGALIAHWNQSPWAKEEGVSFRIQWTLLPLDKSFLHGKSTLEEHLARWESKSSANAGTAHITTGGLTTYTRGSTLVLGPGKINPRTIAHELGHIMGFADCYLRTLSGQGFFGEAVLEWDNPLYPDDLMCDNNVGVPRAEAW